MLRRPTFRAAITVAQILLLAVPAEAGDLLRGGAAASNPRRTATAGANAGASEAAALRANARDRLSRTTQALQSVKALQAAARAAAQGGNAARLRNPLNAGQRLPVVPDGLRRGGLQLADGVPKNLAKPRSGENSALWIGAKLPRESAGKSGGKTVTIVQTEPTALLNWKTFNVGRKTTLEFDQRAGGADRTKWIAFNKVNDPSGRPSQILGSIKADGQVYVINRNGILFGGSSQVNVHTLVASALPINDNLIARGLLDNPDSEFLLSATRSQLLDRTVEIQPVADPIDSRGVTEVSYVQNNGQRAVLAPGTDYVATLDRKTGLTTLTFTPAGLAKAQSGREGTFRINYLGPSGDVIVQEGARLMARTSAAKVGGRIMLAGANVRNAGEIATPDGQTILAAGLQVGIAAHDADDPSLRGLDPFVGVVDDPTVVLRSTGGVATNAGLIEAPRGNVTITGKKVEQLGAIESSTSVSLNGRVDLLANYNAVSNPASDPQVPTTGGPFLSKSTGQVVLGEGSLIRILPEIGSSERVIGTTLALPSRVNIVGGTVHADRGSTMLAPGATVDIAVGRWLFQPPTDATGASAPRNVFLYTAGQIYLDRNAVIDVSGTTGVRLELSRNLLEVELGGNELADAPLQRGGVLRSIDGRTVTLTVDLRESGTYEGREWLGTPLGDVTGFANLIERTVDELTVAGGNVNLRAGGSVVAQRGSLIDVSGGWKRFSEGFVDTTRVLSGGRIIDIADATPDLVYDGIYDPITVVTRPKWSIREVYRQPLALGTRRFDPSYVEGAGAGSIAITAPAMALDGRFTGRVTAGTRQLRDANRQTKLPAAAKLTLTFEAQDPTPYAVAQFPAYSPTPPRITFDPRPLDAVASFGFDALGNPLKLDRDRQRFVHLSPDLINEEGFGTLVITNSAGRIDVPAGVTLETSPGGGLDFKAGRIEVGGDIRSPGGKLAFTVYAFSPYQADLILSDNTRPDYFTPPPNPGRGNFILRAGGSLSTAGGLVDDRAIGARPYSRPLLLDGGSVDITAFGARLVKGSTIDVSAGVAIDARNRITYGDAGSIAVRVGQDPRLPSLLGGRLTLGSTLRGYGGDRGGAITLQAPLLRIGAATQTAGRTHIPTDFFNQGGFSRFTFIGIGDRPPRTDPIADGNLLTPEVAFRRISDDTFRPGLVIERGANIAPVVETLFLRPRADGNTPAIETTVLPVGQRPEISLSFSSRNVVDTFTQRLAVRGDLIMREGARIDAGPRGRVAISGDAVSILGGVRAAGGTITVRGADKFPLVVKLPEFAQTTVYLGPAATLSTAGTSIFEPSDFGFRRGEVLPGGRIELAGNILAEAGSLLDVSGTSETFDFTAAEIDPNFGGDRARVSVTSGLNEPLQSWVVFPRRVDSDAGSISLAGGQQLFVASDLRGTAGGPTASGGSLSVRSGLFNETVGFVQTVRDVTLVVSQDNNGLPNKYQPNRSNGLGATVRNGEGRLVPGHGYFAADLFQAGGFDSLELGGTVRFRGRVDLIARQQLAVADAGVIYADRRVRLTAPYVRLGTVFRAPLGPLDPARENVFQAGGQPFNFSPSHGSGNLVVRARLIDIGNLSLQNIGRATLVAGGGDIRGNGTFDIAGDLTLRAGQIYPASGVTFTIAAWNYRDRQAEPGDPLETGSVTIEASGSRRLPLSAGGTLNVFASEIVQAGVLRAPIGRINLGWDGSGEAPRGLITGRDVAITERLTLERGSETSVTAVDSGAGQDLLIPYGLLVNGTSWIDPTGFDITVGGVPAKDVRLGARQIVARSGSTIDLRGGGDLYAYRWVPGTGGSRDVLASDGSYAVLPGYEANFAPYAPFNTGSEAAALDGAPGYVNPSLRVGDQVYLSGSDALAAGTYTLLPARYALLPGAVLVTPRSGPTTGPLAVPDGSRIVSGYRYNSLNSTRERPEVYSSFEVASTAVVRSRSTYEDYSANQFLAESARTLEVDVARLPVDAGHLVFQAVDAMRLRGNVLSSRPAGGIGAYVDISSPANIVISGRTLPRREKGTLVLRANDLTRFGAESLFVGGVREISATGTTANVFAANLTVDNAGSPLEAPEITLATKGALTLAPRAEVIQVGTMVAAAQPLSVVGDGALVRVSSDPAALTLRTGVTTAEVARLNVGRRSIISGVSLTLDSSYGTDLDPRANLVGDYVSLSSGQISLRLSAAGKLAPTDGLVLAGGALRDLQGVKFLSLLSYTSIDTYGGGRLAVDGALELHAAQIRGFAAGKRPVVFAAGDLLVDNRPGGRRLAAGPADSGTLVFEADRVRLGSRRVIVDQFANLLINADRQVRLEKSGALVTRGDLTITTPYVDADPSSVYEIASRGALRLIAPETGVATAVSPGLGATLTLRGSSVVAESSIVLPSGQIDLVATRGDVTVGGLIDVSGAEVAFDDVLLYTDAGRITLSAAQGSVTLQRAGQLDLSASPRAGSAGLLSVSAPTGDFRLLGNLDARPGRDGLGGRFDLDIGRLPEFSRLGITLARASFSGEQTIRVREGDVLLNGVARTSSFRLSVDNGDLRVTGTVDVSGERGGEIALLSAGSLTVADAARLTVAAETFDAAGKGGSIHLEAGSSINGVASSTARLSLERGAELDLTVAAAKPNSASLGQFTGTLHLRAPRDATNTDLGIDAIDATIRGASSIVVEGYRIYDLTASNGVMSAAVRTTINNDGIAFLGAAGTDSAAATAILARLLANNARLEPVLSLRPGVELVNRTGDLRTATGAFNVSNDWNLHTFRYGAKRAPGVLTLRAAGDVLLLNAIQDGFDITNGQFAYRARLLAANPDLPINAQSWSYRITAGADVAAADFRRVQAVAGLAENKGSLLLGRSFPGTVTGGIGGATTQNAIAPAANNSRYQVIRTGSGDIDISAGRDVRLLNPFAAIYTAGTAVADPTLGGRFDVPILNNNGSQPFLGAIQQPATTAQYSLGGGDIRIAAQVDVVRYNVTNTGAINPDSSRQLPTNWLYRRGYVDPITGEFGVARFGDVASTTWWVDFANFFQSVGTLGGGNITMLAGRDVSNIDAVAPTNARMPKGPPDADGLIELGGGDILVRAGRDIDAGIFYVERGEGRLDAGRDIRTNASRSPSIGLTTGQNPLPEQTWLPTTLFVGKGGFDVRARGNVLLGPVANPFLLPGGVNNTAWYKTFFSTYDPGSHVSVQSLGGDITFRQSASLPFSSASLPLLRIWLNNVLLQTTQGSVSLLQPWLRLNETRVQSFNVTPTILPASLRATAFSGNLNLVGNLTLTPSPRGTVELLAGGSLNGLSITGINSINQPLNAWGASRINLSDANPAAIPRVTTPFAYQRFVGTANAGYQSLVDNFLSTIDVLFAESGSPNNALAAKQTLHARGPLHLDDPDPVRLYALDGDISGVTLFSPKAARIVAGNDITDVAFYVQNVRPDDVSTVVAGRDIIPFNASSPLRSLATSAGNILNFGETPLAGDIQVSGPGSLEVLAGRNLDLGTGANNPDGTGTGITTIGNLRNPFLPFEGASIRLAVGLGDVATGIDFEGFIEEYLTQAGGTSLQVPDPNDPEKTVPFADLSPARQRAVAVETFFRLLRDAGRSGEFDSGYTAIDTLFPAGAYQGELNARARDIRTRNGGEIQIFAPGGGVTLANTVLGNVLAPPGVITETGGNISIFTDTDVDIGIGRIFTLRGGDITIWSSTGDIAAGSAARTVASAPPTRVTFDPQSADLQTDLAGLATGGGIGVLATVAGVAPGSVDLIAPVGTVDAGEAGIRATGTVNVAAERVLNASNISAAAGTSGVPSSAPPPAPPPAAPPAASNPTAATNAAANQIANQARTQAGSDEAPSVITVEVLGYGGGEDSAAAPAPPAEG